MDVMVSDTILLLKFAVVAISITFVSPPGTDTEVNTALE
jgi:hypothetical protein